MILTCETHMSYKRIKEGCLTDKEKLAKYVGIVRVQILIRFKTDLKIKKCVSGCGGITLLNYWGFK